MSCALNYISRVLLSAHSCALWYSCKSETKRLILYQSTKETIQGFDAQSFFYKEINNRQKSHNLESYTNKGISAKILNIIIRTNHGQTEIVMQCGVLRNSVTCVPTYCNNDSFASPNHRITRWIKACEMLFHSCTSASRSSCGVSGRF